MYRVFGLVLLPKIDTWIPCCKYSAHVDALISTVLWSGHPNSSGHLCSFWKQRQCFSLHWIISNHKVAFLQNTVLSLHFGTYILKTIQLELTNQFISLLLSLWTFYLTSQKFLVFRYLSINILLLFRIYLLDLRFCSQVPHSLSHSK